MPQSDDDCESGSTLSSSGVPPLEYCNPAASQPSSPAVAAAPSRLPACEVSAEEAAAFNATALEAYVNAPTFPVTVVPAAGPHATGLQFQYDQQAHHAASVRSAELHRVRAHEHLRRSTAAASDSSGATAAPSSATTSAAPAAAPASAAAAALPAIPVTSAAPAAAAAAPAAAAAAPSTRRWPYPGPSRIHVDGPSWDRFCADYRGLNFEPVRDHLVSRWREQHQWDPLQTDAAAAPPPELLPSSPEPGAEAAELAANLAAALAAATDTAAILAAITKPPPPP
jgi:hypothetical protein